MKRYHIEKSNLRSSIFNIYKFLEYCIIFLVGANAYFWIEVAFRGYSHWSMTILGGISLLIIGFFNEGTYPKHWGLIPQMVSGGVIITALELIWGIVFNILLGMQIWDYSNMPFNFLGQICPQFTFAWIGLTLIAILLDDTLRRIIFHEPFPTYHLLFCKCQ